MSYLAEKKEAEGPEEPGTDKAAPQDHGITKMILSVWVKLMPKNEPEDKWKAEWLPPSIDTMLTSNSVAFAGSSYWTVMTDLGEIISPSRLSAWPPGGGGFMDTPQTFQGTTFKHGVTPFLSWGDPKQVYKRVEWELRTLRSDYWIFGRGGAPQNFVAQHPKDEPVAEELGVVPPSCIGCKERKLIIILQTSARAKYTGYVWAMGKAIPVHVMSPYVSRSPFSGPPFSVPDGYKDFAAGSNVNQFVGNAIYYDDVSDLEFGQHPETFIMEPDVVVGDGRWHHVLLSVDLGVPVPDGGVEAAGPPQPDGTPPKGPAGLITVEATGPKADPPLPGTYGQYSGAHGEYELAPFGYIINDPGYPTNVSYASKAAYGAPFEENGLGSGPPDGGTIQSECKAWLWVDGVEYKGKDLHHAKAWSAVESQSTNRALGPLKDEHKIVPVNALVALTGDPRAQITTSQTHWEREYRTLLGGFNGPAARIDETDEKRRYSYPLPKYELFDATLKRGQFNIPAGLLWFPDDKEKALKWNLNCQLAELQIWTGKSEELTQDIVDLFLSAKDKKPVGPLGAEKKFGKPNIKLHFAANWKVGNNTGLDGFRKTGEGIDKEKVMKPEAKLDATGRIDRYQPDPKVGVSS